MRVEVRRRSPVSVRYFRGLLLGTLARGLGTRLVALLELERGAGDGRQEIGRDQAIEPFCGSAKSFNPNT